jgi:hypothetical protein
LFIKANATDDDRRKLVNLIRHAPKPQTMGVGPYFYRLRDLNEQVIWLPGTEVKLTAKQLDHAFHDGMPQSWQNCYSNAGLGIQYCFLFYWTIEWHRMGWIRNRFVLTLLSHRQ